MAEPRAGRIFIGVGGWSYQPWRGAFYPSDLTQKRELEFASRNLTSIEINGTFYGSQKPATFQKWHDETPADFVFSLKAPRFATNRKVLGEAGKSIERFFSSGVTNLADKLGPVNWQLPPYKKFEAEDFRAFLALLPPEWDRRPLRHVVEVRHSSFRSPELVALARERGIAVVIAGDSRYPQIADLTAPFVYARIMGTREDAAQGYRAEELDRWAARARSWALGALPEDLEYCGEARVEGAPRDVYLYVISGHKARNPAAAMALIERVRPGGPAPAPAEAAKPAG
jgi:uncharacterized protein YecE (DUF72 family)